MPIIPTDLFPRELSSIIGTEYPKVKLIFDVSCLLVTGVMTLVFLGHLDGLGLGTILAAFTMGKAVGLIGSRIDQHFSFAAVSMDKAPAWLRKRASKNIYRKKCAA